MFRKILPYLVFIALVTTFSTSSSSQTLEWAKSMGGAGWDKSAAIAVDGDGNVYGTGIFPGTVDFDPGTGVFNLTSGGTQDVFITKFDASGNFIWAKQLGDAGWEESHDIAIDKEGNIYTTGFFLGPADFDPGPATFILNSSPGGDAFISKLDLSGNFIWAKQLGGNLAVTAYSIAVDDSGNVYTTGFFDGTTDFDPGPDTSNLTVAGYSDMFISKLDSSGDFVWAKQIRGPQGEIGHAIEVDDNGNIYTTGTFFGTADFDPGPGTFFLSSPMAQESFLCKLDVLGNFVWAKQMGGEVGHSIAFDQAGNIYTTGYYGWDDISITKLDPSGQVIWAKEFGAVMANTVVVDDQYNVYTTGQFFGTRDFDPGTDTFYLTASGSTDCYINKLDSSGNLVWVRQLGGTDEVWSSALALDGHGNIYTTGTFNGIADFDPGATVFNMTSTGSYDIFFHKLKSDGTGVSENNFENLLKIYPNPASGYVNISLPENYSEATLGIFNINGGLMIRKEISSAQQVDINDLPPGMYFYKVKLNEQQLTGKLIIQR